MIHETVNWNELEARAAGMSEAELRGAIAQILEVLPFADELDRTTGSDRGGFYRDQSSVFRRELRARADRGRCRTCGR